jgi:hypothetical protein
VPQDYPKDVTNNIADDKHCVRGLERMAEARVNSLNRNRYNAYDADLIEQEAQFEDGSII